MRFEYNNTTYTLGFKYSENETIAQLRMADACVAIGFARKHPADCPNRVVGRVIALRNLNNTLAKHHNTEIDKVGRALMWDAARSKGLRGIR